MRKILKVMTAGLTCLLLTMAGRAASVNVLHTFGVLTNVTGMNPQAKLVAGPDGTLYGTAMENSPYSGVIFKIGSDGSRFMVLRALTTNDASGLFSGLVLAGNTLYGTASGNNLADSGKVFKINTDGSGFGVLHTFDPSVAGEGLHPVGALILSGSTLYGATSNGGAFQAGSLFAVNTNGSGYTNFFSVDSSIGFPAGRLLLAGNRLYGALRGVEAEGSTPGSIFAINTDGTGFTNIYVFSPFGYYPTNTDGGSPNGGLILSNGTLYGTALTGGVNGWGTVFSVRTNGSQFTELHEFTADQSASAAQLPNGELSLVGNTLYGTTAGDYYEYDPQSVQSGSVFEINTDGSGYANLHSFGDAAFENYYLNIYTNADGVQPLAGVVVCANQLFGVAAQAGPGTAGTLFRLNTDGAAFAVLNAFSPPGATQDGAAPESGLVISGNTLYGGTTTAGPAGFGTIFRIKPDGSGFGTVCLQGSWGAPAISNNVIYSLGGYTGYSVNTDGSGLTNFYTSGYSETGPVLSGNKLYGVSGGAIDYVGPDGGIEFATLGSVFALDLDGRLTNIYNFTGGGDGGYPISRLLLSGNTLYGATAGFAVPGFTPVVPSTIFKVNVDGSGFAVLHTFPQIDYYVSPGDGPFAGLTLSGNTLYGTTYAGGNGQGTIFSVTTNGDGFTNLYTFSGGDGANPDATLILSSNVLYGTTQDGGGAGFGTVFSVNTDGSAFNSIYSFTNGLDGANPAGENVLIGKTLFGATKNGGLSGNGGVVFALNLAQSPRLNIQLISGATVLTWSNPAFHLQAVSTIPGTFANVPGATSPYTNSISSPAKFFRLSN